MDKQKKCELLSQIKQYIPKEMQPGLEKEMESFCDELQEEAYMEGYRYAIRLLQESMKNKNH